MPAGRQSESTDAYHSGRAHSGRGRAATSGRRALHSRKFSSMDGFVRTIPARPKPASVRTPSLANNAVAPARHPSLPKQRRSQVLSRQHTARPTQKLAKSLLRQARPAKKSFTSRTLVVLAILVFVAGGYVSYTGWQTNRQAAAQVASLQQNIQEDIPDESDVDETAKATYQVAPDMPRYLRINTIGVDARVKRMDVKANGELEAPHNIYDVGWYNGSAKPGENGTMLMDGHVHGPSKPGVFNNLKNVAIGSVIEVERGDGEVFRYEVRSSETAPYDKVDMKKALKSIEPGKNGLNLITCTGSFDAVTGNYQDRLVVYAVAVE